MEVLTPELITLTATDVLSGYTNGDGRIGIGNPLRLSPGFPLLYTVRAGFLAHGVPTLDFFKFQWK